jgi:hypothetical protein
MSVKTPTVVISGAYLSVPPPTEQCPVCYPRIEALFTKPFEVRADHVQLRLGAFFIRHNSLEVAAVVVTQLIALSGKLSAKAQRLRQKDGLIASCYTIPLTGEQTYPGSWKYFKASFCSSVISSRR